MVYQPKKVKPIHTSGKTINSDGNVSVRNTSITDQPSACAAGNEYVPYYYVPYYTNDPPFFNTLTVEPPYKWFKSKEDTTEEAVPIYKKYALTIKEATAYFGIGERKLRKLVDANEFADWFFMNGAKILIKRKQFEKYLDEASYI